MYKISNIKLIKKKLIFIVNKLNNAQIIYNGFCPYTIQNSYYFFSNTIIFDSIPYKF